MSGRILLIPRQHVGQNIAGFLLAAAAGQGVRQVGVECISVAADGNGLLELRDGLRVQLLLLVGLTELAVAQREIGIEFQASH